MREVKLGYHYPTKIFYSKSDLNELIIQKNKYNKAHPINLIFNYEGKQENIPYEDLLFIHEYKSDNLNRSLIYKAIVIPLNINIVNSFLGAKQVYSVFKKYMLFESNGEFSRMSTHIPRHNINTFLALSGLAEHLQAMLMGRIDIRQNQYYQHLALKQRRKTTSLFANGKLLPIKVDSEPDCIDGFAPITSIVNDGIMNFSMNNDLEGNLKRNLHSFDSSKEVSTFIQKSFKDDYFLDIAEAFNELINTKPATAESLVQRHAFLHPLIFGSCMRNVVVHDCPKRMSCISGVPCGNFTVTNRKGELENLSSTLQRLLAEFSKTQKALNDDESYSEMLDELAHRITNLKSIKEQIVKMQNKLTPILVFPYLNPHIESLPTTLSELFAIEQIKLEGQEKE